MNSKISTYIFIILVMSFILFACSDNGKNNKEKQLYTCGMHPDIISDEPGNCPICEMKLTPVKNEKSKSGERKVLYWRAPMDPNEIYNSPGKSKMGMDLVPVYDDEESENGVVSIDGTLQQTMNLKTEVVKEKELSTAIITNGLIKIDERREFVVNTKVSGWVEKLYVNFEGQKVKKGQKLIEIYSPELIAAQQELLSTVTYTEAIYNSKDIDLLKSGNKLLKSSINKLKLLDIPIESIEEILETKQIQKYVTLFARADGTVLVKDIVEGEKINAGQKLLHIADLQNLWMTADIYESDLNLVSLGLEAEIMLDAYPGEEIKGIISFIDPVLDKKSRVTQIRINLNNFNGKLKPSMYGKVSITGKSFGVGPVISETAVIRSGKNNLVILALGKGKFKPLPVKLGGYSEGYYRIKKGLKAGDRIVTSAQFLIDSESNLRAAMNMFNSSTKSDSLADSNIHGHQIKNEYGIESPLIRTGIIDVESVDKNNDGIIYQDPMDWNVLSDEPGRCPVCEMKLIEVKLGEAKANLRENGYEYK